MICRGVAGQVRSEQTAAGEVRKLNGVKRAACMQNIADNHRQFGRIEEPVRRGKRQIAWQSE